MKNILTLLFLSLYSIGYSQGDLTLTWDQEDIICKEGERAEELIKFTHSRNEFAHQTDMHYQVMNWEIDPDNYYIKGEISYYFQSLVPGLTQLILDLTDDLTINSIKRNGSTLTYVHGADQLLHINLGKTLAAGAYDTLTINYEGIPPSNGFGSFEQGSHAGAPIIWTLSEPYGARDWWPNKQDLIDKIDSVDIFITTPDSNLAASNGKLMSIFEKDGKLEHHWRHRYPIVAYLVALSVTNYAAYSQYVPLTNGDSIEILNYVYPETLEASRAATESSVDIMQLYNELFEIYPFAAEKYGHAQFGWGGGEEHQTMSFMGNFSFGLQAHEMAHQWFGDKVTCGSWRDIWLNEGFATYLTGLTYEKFSPDLYWLAWKNSTSNSATSQPGGSVWVDDTTSVNRIFNGRLSYNKGAYLLHMLRWITSDSAFFNACRHYLDGPGTSHDFGTTQELKTYFEEESGRDFDEFLADWFYGQGWPSYHLRWMQQTDSVIVWVGQEQSHASVNFFEMPIPILVRAGGFTNIFRVEHTQDDQRFSFYIGNTIVDSIGFDPDKWILSRNNTISEIITSVEDQYENEAFIIYPNPAKDFIEIISPHPVNKIDFVDGVGHISTLEFHDDKIDITSFVPGIYTVILKNEFNSVVSIKRLVINK